MSAMMTGQNWNAGEIDVSIEVDLNASAAVIATRGDDVTVTKTGVGTYSAVFKGSKNTRLVEVVGNGPNIRAAAINGNVQSVQITSITQASSASGIGNDDITVLFTTKTSAPAAADTTSAITVCIWFAFRSYKTGSMASPI